MMSPRNTQGKPRHPLADQATSARLSALLRHARRIDSYEAELARTLDTPLKRHCRIANVTSSQILLDVDSPIWAQRLRFMLPAIERQFSRPVVMRVRPEPSLAPQKPVAGHRPSQTGARALNALAAALEVQTGNPTEHRDPGRLSRALRNLAKRVHPGESAAADSTSPGPIEE